MADRTGRGGSLPPGMRYWRRTGLPDQWWPWGVLPLAGMALLFAVGVFGIAVQVEQETQASVERALADFGIEHARVEASGQNVKVSVDAPASAEAQIRAIAASAACNSWVGQSNCATHVEVDLTSDNPFSGSPRLDIQLPEAAGGASQQTKMSKAEASATAAATGKPHDFLFRRDEGGIVLGGDVPSESVRQKLIAMARQHFERVTPELEITNTPATADFQRAAARALEVLARADRGMAAWQSGRLSIRAEAVPALHAELKAEFNQTAEAPPLGEIQLIASEAPARSADDLACPVAFGTVLGRHPIAFETGSATMTSDSRQRMRTLVSIARRCPGKIVVEGHTDNVGLRDNNRTLSLDRAQAVLEALVSAGVARDRLSAEGLGESQPVADNGSAEGRALNRRIVLTLRPPPPEPTGPCSDQVAQVMAAGKLDFDTGSTRLKQDSNELLQQLVTVLRRCPGRVVVESHTDNVGLQGRNRSLSLDRAKAVSDAIVAAGIPRARLRTLGLGEDLPVADNETADGRNQNRRIEVQLVEKQLREDTARCREAVTTILEKQAIEFRTGSHYLTDESQPVISRLARELSRCSASVVVAGHTDDVGDESENQRLSWRRADAVRDGLVERGLAGGRVHAVGFGESEPAHSNNTDAGRALNRRIEVMLDSTSEVTGPVQRCNSRLDELLAAGDLQFATGSDSLVSGASETIGRIAATLRQCEGPVVIEGHTDDVGDENNNQHLSWRRARSIKQALQGAGVPQDRMRAIGFGEGRPVASNDTDAGRASNRRISIHVAP